LAAGVLLVHWIALAGLGSRARPPGAPPRERGRVWLVSTPDSASRPVASAPEAARQRPDSTDSLPVRAARSASPAQERRAPPIATLARAPANSDRPTNDATRPTPIPSPGRATPAPSPSGQAPWPRLATRIPPSVELHYQSTLTLKSGTWHGDASLSWHTEASAYALHVSLATDGRAGHDWQATGRFDAEGLAPDELVEREDGHGRRALRFDRATHEVRFPGHLPPRTVVPGAQDRWSWIAQLAAIAEAHAGAAVPAGTHWPLEVAGLRGELDVWDIEVIGTEAAADEAGRARPLLHVVRVPTHPYDLRIEAWLAAELHHFPVELRLETPPSRWGLSLRVVP